MSTPHYFAKATDIEGNEIHIPVADDGTVQVSGGQKIRSLQTNALKVFCRNNELESLEAPEAISVGCNKNKLTHLSLPNAEHVHCAENKLETLHAPKATQVKCMRNKLTTLTLESVTDLECSGNELRSLEAPHLRNIDCEVPRGNGQQAFAPVQEIEIVLNNTFDPDRLNTYDITSLDVTITLDLHKQLVVEDLTFLVALQEVNYYNYRNESGIDAFEIYLMRFKDTFGQHNSILKQAPALPMTLSSPQKMDFSIPVFASPAGHQNFLDIIKQAPAHILKQEKELHLHITFYLNPDQPNEKYDYRIFKVSNPFFGS